MRNVAWLVVVAGLAGCGGREETEPGETRKARILHEVHDDTDIAEDTIIAPGVYRVRDVNGDGVLRIKADGVKLTLSDVTLVGADEGAAPDTFEGIAILVEGRKGVNLEWTRSLGRKRDQEGGVIRGYRGGVVLRRCTDSTIDGVDVSDNRAQRLKSTPTKCDDGADWLAPHFNDQNEWFSNYGAGIYLDECTNVTVKDCRGRRTQNGICLRNTNDSFIIDNDMSWMSGWGIALWRSSRNEISHNNADYCVRGYSHGVYDRGQDSSGILMFEQCSDNIIAFNSATHGGDGIFMYAGHETTQRTGKGGCNNNLLYGNDFSHAVANAIECTFSDGNRFIENILDDSNYGVWGGYSYNTKIVGNKIRKSRIAGIAIEHGHDNHIEANVIEDGNDGVQLWWDEDAEFLKSVYGQNQNCRSEKTRLVRNMVGGNRRAVWLRDTSGASIQVNDFQNNRVLLHLEGPCAELLFEANDIRATKPEAWIRNDTGGRVKIAENAWSDTESPKGENLEIGPQKKELILDYKTITHAEKAPAKLHGSRDTSLPKETRRGMDTIMVDEWGPCDPTVPKLMPAYQAGGGELTYHVFGPAGTWEIESHDGGVTFEPTKDGKVPGPLRVLAASTPADGRGRVLPFTFAVKTSSGARLTAAGCLVQTQWTVDFWAWTPGDGEHGDYASLLNDEGWKTITSAKPVLRRSMATLSRPWEGHPVWHDHFCDRSTTTIHFPAGTYDFETVSDDGVRVFVDGKKVIDNWTWHAPFTDTVAVDLTEGAHEIVVEHFEIDGYEQLDFVVMPRKKE